VSVVIPARNEEENLESCLKAFLSQSYPTSLYELIVVNDHSTDKTGDIAQAFAARYPFFHAIHLTGDKQGKKAALAAGVRKAKGEVVLQTDADCKVGKEWIEAMTQQFKPNTAMVSGPVELTFNKHSLFERLQCYEYMGLSVLGGGSIARNKPNMSNGANLGFRKSVFQEVEGYKGIDGVASGDDELLMQKIDGLGKYDIVYAKCQKAIVQTPALSDWKSFKAQRIRWVSKARYYINKRINITQSISYLAFLGIPFCGILSCFYPFYLYWFLLICSIKFLADAYNLYHAGIFFHKLHVLVYLLPLQLAYLFYVLWIGIVGNRVRSYIWKSREVS